MPRTEHDCVIVGAGSSGSVIARRLLDQGHSVHVVEAGPVDDDEPVVSENTYDGYEVAVRVHLVPGVGKHRMDRLEPEHLESLYRRMLTCGSKPGTAHQAHRTARTGLGEAVRRGHVAKNAAALAKPPRMEEEEVEVEPYDLDSGHWPRDGQSQRLRPGPAPLRPWTRTKSEDD